MSVIQISLRARLLRSRAGSCHAMLLPRSGGTEPGAAQLALRHGLLSVKFSVLQFPFWKVGEKSESVCVCVHACARAEVGDGDLDLHSQVF